MSLSHQQVREILPHRHPIIMVDRVVSRDIGKSIHAIKNVNRNEPYVRNPLDRNYPRALVIESFLQAGGILCYDAWSEREDISNCAMLFVGLTGLSWHREVPLGCQLHHHAHIDILLDEAAIYHGEVRIDDEIILVVERVTVAVRPVGELMGAAR